MHILFLTDNFPPEGNAPASRTYEHAREWIKKGDKVTIITCAPNFPEGKVYSGYKNAWYHKENMEGIDVIRVKTYMTSNEGFILRILDFLSFMVSSFFAGLFVKRVDVVIATSPQFFTAISGLALSFIKRKKFVFELRDIWPASITAVGAMKRSIAIRLLEKLEMFLYQRSDHIVAVTQSFKRELEERGISGRKISVVVNGVDLGKYQPVVEKPRRLVEQYKLSGKFVIGYIGTHGMAHGLEHVINAANLLKNRQDITFLFVGGGAAKAQLVEQVNSQNLKNVIFLPRKSKDEIVDYWGLCDVSLISLKDEALFKTVIPSKIFESMGMALPMIAAIPNGEAANIIRSNDAGIIVKPGTSIEIADAIVKMSKREDANGAEQAISATELARNSHKAAKNYERKILATKMREILANVINSD